MKRGKRHTRSGLCIGCTGRFFGASEEVREMECGAWRTAASVRFPNGRWELTLSGALHRRREGRLEFALPYSPARPWALPELFCFARVEEIGEGLYIIYAFDENKTPIF